MRAGVCLATILLCASARAEDAQWPMATKSWDNQRYSSLDQITVANVSRLRAAWHYDLDVKKGQEAAPIVVDDTMYVVGPFPNALYALDLHHPGTARYIYRPKVIQAAPGVACCDVVNRGAAYDKGRIFFNTLDDQTIAVDARSGRELWATRVGNINHGETMTMAPMVVKDRVLVGNSGGEMGVRGWLTALDAATGAIVWRAYSTGSDADVLIGGEFRPHYPSDRGADLGIRSWPPDQWRLGGGNVWGFLSYDPALDLVYYGTGNPGPWNPDQRPGDNKWTAGVFARRPETGQAVWYYQFSPHDLYDHDGVNEMVAVDLTIDGKPRAVLLHPDRNGHLYVLDRATGEVLSATPFSHITTSKGVDLTTGRLVPIASKTPGFDRTVRGICPAPPGAKDWQPSSWSPLTRLLYIPHNNLCADEQGYEASYIAGTPYLGVRARYYFGPGGKGGAVTAWDPVAKRAAWKLDEDFPVWSGALATAGGVVFYGTMDGWFKAVDAKTGKLLWKHEVTSGVIGQPVSYRGPDGKQYVAVMTGVGGWAGALVSGGLDVRDQGAALGFVNAMKRLREKVQPGATLYVFSL
jgi:PQQ-dependent dehydrogenase (methanol/ethanol family)